MSEGVARWRVLLVEDNAFNRALATALLTRRGHAVTAVENGREAVERTAGEPFDLVLMDIQMPELDGLAATRLIRAREASEGRARLPIVALTGGASAEEAAACREAGMDGHLPKPIQPAALWAELARLLGTPESALDPSGLLAEAGGDRDLLVRLVGIYGEQSQKLRGELGRAVADGDAEAIRRTAHALKSLVGHWRWAPAFEAAAQLEDDWASARSGVYDQLERELVRLDRELELLVARLGGVR